METIEFAAFLYTCSVFWRLAKAIWHSFGPAITAGIKAEARNWRRSLQ